MVRQAQREDFAAIDQWRQGHFTHIKSNMYRPVCGQRGPDDAFWLVLEENGRPIAAVSYTDDAETKRRFVHDLYGAPTYAMATLALAELLERMCDRQGYELRGDTDPENVRFIEILMKRGYELTRVGFRRPPRARGEKKQGSGQTAPADEAEGAVSFLRGSHA